MCNGRTGQYGSSLWSLLLGMALAMVVLLLWQRLLLHAQSAAKVRQAQAETMAQYQWLQARLRQDLAATLTGPCVQPPDHGVMVTHASLFALTPSLWSQSLLSHQGFGPRGQYTLTHVVVAETPQLLAYLASPSDYGWVLSRCDVAWSFQPTNWARLSGQRLLIELPEGWVIGMHPRTQSTLLSLQVTETIRYQLGTEGVERRNVRQPELVPMRAPRLTRLQLQPWWRIGCGEEVHFQTAATVLANLVFYEVQLGWTVARQEHVLTSTVVGMPTQAC